MNSSLETPAQGIACWPLSEPECHCNEGTEAGGGFFMLLPAAKVEHNPSGTAGGLTACR